MRTPNSAALRLAADLLEAYSSAQPHQLSVQVDFLRAEAERWDRKAATRRESWRLVQLARAEVDAAQDEDEADPLGAFDAVLEDPGD